MFRRWGWVKRWWIGRWWWFRKWWWFWIFWRRICFVGIFEDDDWFEDEIGEDEKELEVRFIISGGEFEIGFDDEWGFLLSFVDDCLYDDEVEDNEHCDKFSNAGFIFYFKSFDFGFDAEVEETIDDVDEWYILFCGKIGDMGLDDILDVLDLSSVGDELYLSHTCSSSDDNDRFDLGFDDGIEDNEDELTELSFIVFVDDKEGLCLDMFKWWVSRNINQWVIMFHYLNFGFIWFWSQVLIIIIIKWFH